MGILATRALVVAAAVAGMAAFATRSAAIEFFDERLEIHGFYETQVRAIARDFSPSDGVDLTQWYHILNIEAEADLAPGGFGPFDVFQAFVRIDVRYDCVWTRACSIFHSADAFGDRARKLPRRLNDGRRAGYRPSGELFTGDTRRFADLPREFLPFDYRFRPDGSFRPSELFDIEGLDTLFGSRGVDGVFGTEDDPAPFYFSEQLEGDDCRFGFRARKGSMNGVGTQVMGPWNPKCDIRPIGALRNKPNPVSDIDLSPITGTVGSGPLPFRPQPRNAWDRSASKDQAQGIYYPSYRLAQQLRDGEFGDFDQNFSQSALSWNRGASQEDEGELKEAYLDVEMFDSRLWLRLGKQTVVWGKTELFRNQDQWNPQDLALASLPSLEESRIGLWMARMIWHFWDVGPLEDVRAELVTIFDDFEPTDIGRCGEPYAPNPVCNKTLGLFIHGLTGFGLAGEIRPPDPWESWKGVEVGGRLEWRWDRFSFALSDYWGYTDLPYQETLFRYSRNVDPTTGRPRWGMSTGSCRTGREPSCLTEETALTRHSLNQQLFHMICATSIGFSNLDPSACGQTVFTSQNPALVGGDIESSSPTVAVAVGAILSGQDPNALAPVTGGGLFVALANLDAAAQAEVRGATAGNPNPAGNSTPLASLVVDPNDGPFASHPIGFQNLFTQFGLSRVLTDEQEGLLGCGPFYGISCDIDGVDLMNAEASALMQSFPGFPGTSGSHWDTRDTSVEQPGTVGFEGGPVCTRYEGGRLYVLPGCRGPGDPGYAISVDGSTAGPDLLGNIYQRVHPFTGQRWTSEMAIVSWNTLMALVALSSPAEAGRFLITDFDPGRPFQSGRCSFATPQFCRNVQSFFQISGIQSNTVRAGGNSRFGRRHGGGGGGKEILLRYQKRDIVGFSMDFAEDFTKSNWGIEFTWENDILLEDLDAIEGLGEVDRYNLTISVDRPTFVNFLNQNRTFFINTQWFLQYVDGYRDTFSTDGPFNVLAVLAINTGYFDDRLLPSVSIVYDFGSNSGAWLPQLTYRFTANFSATVGAAAFIGREEGRPMAISPSSLTNRAGRHAYKDFVENGLTAVRDRDEIFLRVRYTF
jgi:hypothetical protein